MTPERQAKETLPIRWTGDGYQTPLEARGRLNREANWKAISQSLLWRREGDKTDRVKTSRRDAGQAWCSSNQESTRVTSRGEAGEGWGRGVGLHKDADKCQVPVSSGDGADTKLVGLTEIKLAHHLLKCWIHCSQKQDPTAGQRNQMQHSKSLSRFHSRITISSTN